MLSSRLLMASCLFFAFGACDSKVTSALDPDLQAKVETITNCIPPQMEKLNDLLDFAALWRQNDANNNPPDPAGLTWSIAGNRITYSITVASCTISGVIDFFNMDGSPFTPTNQTGQGGRSLSQAIDDVATEMRDVNMNPPVGFMVGEFALAGASVSSMGATSQPAALTGRIGGATNDNELESVSTTEGVAAVSGGQPPVQDVVITTTGSETCVFTFRTVDLLTDQFPTQQYPIGTITWSLTNQTQNVTVNGTLTFDGTVTAVLDVSGVGKFNVNLETRDVTAQ